MQQGLAGRLNGSIQAQIPSLRRYARAWLRDHRFADAVVRECLERALSQLNRIEPDLDVRVWLFAHLHDAGTDRIAQAPRAPTADFWPAAESWRAADLDVTHNSREAQRFRRAFDRLSAEERQILLLTGLEGLTARESAQVLGISAAAATAWIGRARQRLRSVQAEQDALSDAVAPNKVVPLRRHLPAASV